MLRALVMLAALAALAAGCTPGGGASEAERAEACVERFMARAGDERYTEEQRDAVERYLRETYCERFEREGWVHDDGTLGIEAHRWALGAGTAECAAAEAGEPAETVPCPPLEEAENARLLDCAMLHYVRKGEAEDYLRDLQGRLGRDILCEDGTPVERLGAS